MLPFISIQVQGVNVKALVDTGCEQSVVQERLARELKLVPRGPVRQVLMLNGQTTTCKGEATIAVKIGSHQSMSVQCMVAQELVGGCKVILGMDVISKLGGVTVSNTRDVVFNALTPKAVGLLSSSNKLPDTTDSKQQTIDIDDQDFSAHFDGWQWTVKWKWKDGEPMLKNMCAEYAVADNMREEYDKQVQQWIGNGWLQPYDKTIHGQVTGLIPLLAARQPNKPTKVRPVMDYSKELNDYISNHPGLDTAVCQEKLREWRKLGGNACVLDLQKAYLQLHVDVSLQRFQAVRYCGKTYVMTRMGFGLNVAPKIMTKILSKVLSLDRGVDAGTDHYIDDIWVNESVVSVDVVREHLYKFGLVTKEPVALTEARVLGLKVTRDEFGNHQWARDTSIPEVGNNVSKRELFSICGKLLGHYPVAGWLRVACSYVKRLAEVGSWDNAIPGSTVTMLHEMVNRVLANDPVQGEWSVSDTKRCKVWCDASSIAVGASIEVEGHIVEDAAWLRKVDDSMHINVAELEAVIKGLNLAIKWGMIETTIITDSVTVYNWVKSVITDSHRPKVNGMCEMIVKRRLGVIGELMTTYNIELSVSLVKSACNKADALTRVDRKWLKRNQPTIAAVGQPIDVKAAVKSMHEMHHLGVGSTLYLAKQRFGPDIERGIVENVVKECLVCRRVDPAPASWDKGTLAVDKVWHRLAVDITHMNNIPYLSIIDCGPSRFAIWIKLRDETASSVGTHLQRVFSERGPPVELLSDNGPCFKSTQLSTMLKRWNVRQVFSCAYRPTGNGIVERNHRTIKRMAARSGNSIQEMVFWYNNTPNADGTVPSQEVYSYNVRNPDVQVEADDSDNLANSYRVGDVVYVKPVGAKCTTEWLGGKVTGVVSDTAVEVNGINRHVADLRLAYRRGNSDCNGPTLSSDSTSDEVNFVELEFGNASSSVTDSGGSNDDESCSVDPGRPVRERRPPERFGESYTF